MGCAASASVAAPAKPEHVVPKIRPPSATMRCTGADSDYGEDSEGEVDTARGKSGAGIGHSAVTRDSNPAPALRGSWLQRRAWGNTVSVCQYCIAVDSVEDGRRSARCADAAEWGLRLPRLMAEMDSAACDVYCLQGVQHSKYSAFLEPLFAQRGFKSRITYSTSSIETGSVHSALFVRDVALEMQDHCVMSFSTEAGQAADGVCGLDAGIRESLAACGDMALLARIRHRSSGNSLAVLTTRFTHPDNTVKAVQAALLCRWVTRWLEVWGMDNGCNAPVVVCGDLFTQPRYAEGQSGAEPAYDILTTGKARHKDSELHASRLALRSAYASDAKRQEPAFTSNTEHYQGTRDYIMVGGGVSILDTLGMPYSEVQTSSYPAMPSEMHPSEHLMLASRIEIC